MCDKRFDVFPQTTDEEKRRFELLKRAYIDARLVSRSLAQAEYKMDEYEITKVELSYLAEQRVNELKTLTDTICKEKIAEIGDFG